MIIQLELDKALAVQLEQLASVRGQTPTQTIVELLEQALANQVAMDSKPRPAWIGSAESGIPDLGANADDYLFKSTSKVIPDE